MGPCDDVYYSCSIWFCNTLNLLAHFCSHSSKITMHAPIHISLLMDNWFQFVCMYVCMYFWEAVRGPAHARDRVATVGGRGESLITDIVVFVGILALSNADTFAVQGCWQSWVQILCFLQILAFLSGGPTVFTRILPSFRQIHLSLQWLWHPCRCRFFIMNLALSSAPAFVSQRFCPPWVLIACFLRGFWDFECRSLFSEGFWYSWLQIPLCL
jgi:hypothetical protein